jgi:cell division protein FtsL
VCGKLIQRLEKKYIMITIYLITILMIIFSLIYLYKPIYKLIKQKSIYSSCFKIPQNNYKPMFGHALALSGHISKRGTFF